MYHVYKKLKNNWYQYIVYYQQITQEYISDNIHCKLKLYNIVDYVNNFTQFPVHFIKVCH